ncbi:predicted protein [Naegleria gruberi]|uniref:Predicted protein n=1 Tax=Naegleria gruberi TaxID=5762 RepID=D2VLD2_NAEGR|nr:uncharacterized protein NAEGRDRAFT_69738 [Naegleria gruberi]EFC42289.1 predicted protein [Naegleria gruberi]|eukprot:XP_002675033.1 predicted protein [Naegleria gruberi strain NEG-M]
MYIQKIVPNAFSESRFYNLFMVELLEMVITQTIVLFGVVCFWRGIWGLADFYIHYEDNNSTLRLGWTTLMIGVVGSFITQTGSVLVTRLGILNLLVSNFESDAKLETAQASYSADRGTTSQVGKKHASLWIRLAMKLYTYIVAISIILCWKGSWMVMDGYFEKWFKDTFVTNWISHIIAALVLIWFYTFRSVLSPASMDRENHFESLIVSKWSGLSRPLVKEWAKSFISKNKDFAENA